MNEDKDLTYAEAVEQLDRDESFKAMTATIHTLMIHKGIYTPEEFEAYFLETAKPRLKRQESGKERG